MTESDSKNWYTIQSDDPKKLVDDLVKSGVPCRALDSSRFDGKVVTFPSSCQEEVFKIIGKSSSDKYSLEPTGIDNTYYLIFDGDVDPNHPPGKHFEAWKSMVPVIREVYKEFGIKIIASNPHGNPMGPSDDTDPNVLHVYFWSVPEPSARTHIGKVLGMKLNDAQKDAFKPSGFGTVIKDENGTEFAEVINNNLYVLFDLPHQEGGGKGVTEMFRKVMRAYFAVKNKVEGGLVNFYQANRGSLGISSKDAFVKSCSRLHEKNLEQMENSRREYDEQISKCNQKLVSTIRDREILESKIVPLKNSVEERKRIAASEYEILTNTPHVKDVVVVGDVIHVYTDMITIRAKGDDHYIGEFRIDIHTNGGDFGVRAYNLTNPKKTRDGVIHHPHIKNDGECCLGNVQEGVTRLLAEYQYVILAQLMITFLHTYNEDSTYMFIRNW